jgi:GMC oxidoreductase
MASPPSIDPRVAKTHAALFDTWFPLEELPIAPAIKSDIAGIAAEVRTAMLAAFSQSPFLALLEGMTFPNTLPFYECLARSTNPAIHALVTTPGGYGELSVEHRLPVFALFFKGDCGDATTQMAMEMREAYLSGIWDLPLAVPLTEIQSPQVFIQDTAIYAKRHAPAIPRSRLTYDPVSKTIRHNDGPIDYLIIGSGPGGATVAHALHEAGRRVVLIEKGPFVIWGSMDTRSYAQLMFQHDRATTVDNGVIVRSGETLGGGSTVNIDLAFSPLEGTIQARIANWIQAGLLDAPYYTPDRIAAAYQWVRQVIGTRELSQTELNQDNLALWDGARAFGVDPSLYHLNRFPTGLSPSPVDDKLDAARQLILPAAQDQDNPLSVIPDASVDAIRFAPMSDGKNVRAIGATLTLNPPWTEYGNAVVDPCQLQIPPGRTVSIDAENVVLAAGTIGTTRILLNSAKSTPAIANPRIGKGLIMHPSIPLIGVFDRQINLLEGLDSATFVDAFGVQPGFIFETMAGLPAYGAIMIPGTGRQVYERISQFNQSAGFGAMLVDTPSDANCVTLDDQGDVVIHYQLSAADKTRFRTGVAIGIRMMFLAGAKEVILPSNENFLKQTDFDPTQGVYLTDIQQADLVEQNLAFLPNRTLLTAAHLQATNKMGPAPDVAVVSTRQRVWNVLTAEEVPNLYVMDSSIFPTSVGANPMQAIYTFARIFSERLIHGMDHDRPVELQPARHDRAVPAIRPDGHL